jgi:hypothetical protein
VPLASDSLDGLPIEPRYLPSHGIIVVTCSLLVKLATSRTTAALMTGRNPADSFKVMKLGEIRHDLAFDLVVRGFVSTADVQYTHWHVSKDSSWKNIKEALEQLHLHYFLVSWEEAGVCCLGGAVFGVSWDGIVCRKDDPEQEVLLEIKSGHQPNGLLAFKAWTEGGYTGPVPDSEFSRHVLQVNFYRHSRESERQRAGTFNIHKPTVMKIIYGSPRNDCATIFTLPPEYVFIPVVFSLRQDFCSRVC